MIEDKLLIVVQFIWKFYIDYPIRTTDCGPYATKWNAL